MTPIVYAAAAGAALGVSHHLGPQFLRKLQERRLRDLCREQRCLVITYDDGPTPSLTPELLAVLGRHDAVATFYMLGNRVAERRELFERIHDAGHEIGSHSFEHHNAWKVSPWRAIEDLRRGHAALAPWQGEGALYRPPFGKLTVPAWLAVKRQGMRLGWWTHDSRDSHGTRVEPDDLAQSIVDDGGGVVLMHDFEKPGHTDYAVAATDALLARAKAEGITVLTQGQLLDREQGRGT
ncbi:MAG: polysaccharide deacetylase family protein [Myxococcota bacterium]